MGNSSNLPPTNILPRSRFLQEQGRKTQQSKSKKAQNTKMVGGRLGESIKVREELIKKACSLSLKAHKSSGKPYLHEKIRGSGGGSLPEVIFVFPGSWSVDDWLSTTGTAFGETKVDPKLFPSLRSIGNDEVAAVNDAFFRRFKAILMTPSFANEIKKAVTDKKQIVFAGHSTGGSTAILATLWFLEEYLRPNRSQITPVCVTFGSPLVGDRIFPHALRRENWDSCFIHFVMRYDIVPRTMLTPLSSIQQELQTVLQFFNPKSAIIGLESIANEASTFFKTVMRNVSSVASHAACNLMGSTNSLLETVTRFIELSPYRPFGTYIFCTGNGKLVVVKNPDAVLQLLFYSCQLTHEDEITGAAYRSLNGHRDYENELQESLEMQNVVYLDNHLKELPLSSDARVRGEAVTVNTALNDLGLSARARLCLRAAGELQKQKQRNQDKINSKKNEIEAKLKSIQDYKTGCGVGKVGYYDTFKLQKSDKDFHANIKRIELAGIWDEIIEMLKRYELPDEFEGRKEWIELGTKYRRLVEPLDIANYYRHLKNEDTGPYLIKARPKRYRYTQRWREHAERKAAQGSSSESCFWARVEELKIRNRSYEDMEMILQLERDLHTWFQHSEIGKDVFLAESTFAKWWRELPDEHKRESCLKGFMSN